MEVGVAANEIGLLLKGETALGLHRLEGIEVLEASVGERFVGQGPETLRWLELWRVGGQRDEMDALRHPDGHPGMPAGSIEHEGNPFLCPCSDIPGKGSEHLPEQRCGPARMTGNVFGKRSAGSR